MSNITIVTAFFDIGRGDWTPARGLPHYLERSNDTYIERFARLNKLDNDIVVFTSEELVEKITEVSKGRKSGKTTVVPFNPQKQFASMRESIERVQKSTEFQNLINPNQRLNPEYWNPDYVLVTNLKAHFVRMAVDNYEIRDDLVAWIDFGYCRNESNIPTSGTWEYNFNPEKIHMFNYKEYEPNRPISDIVANNDVYILGAKIVAHKKNWLKMEQLMNASFNELLKYNLVDDDQGHLLVSYLLASELFELHRIPDHQFGHDPFILFNQFNDKV